MTTLVPLAAATDPRLAGRKAATLAQAIEDGHRVPAGWVVTVDDVDRKSVV